MMRVSVVLATYNGAKFIEEQLLSILQGTRVPDQLILVDDASTDDTVALARQVLSNYPNVRPSIHVHPKNTGATQSFIHGCHYVEGDIVLFCDQDDKWSTSKLGRMAETMEQDHQVGLVYSDGEITGADLTPTGRTIFSTRSKAQLSLGMARPHSEVASNPDIKGCTMAVRADIVERVIDLAPPDRIATYWGHDHWIALMSYGMTKVVALKEPLILHRFHDSNSSAGAGFRTGSLSDWRKWMKLVRGQSKDHFVQRYHLALTAMQALGPGFNPQLKDAVQDMLRISEQRYAIKKLSLIPRVHAAYRLYRSGIYRTHYNGVLTFLRDILF